MDDEQVINILNISNVEIPSVPQHATLSKCQYTNQSPVLLNNPNLDYGHESFSLENVSEEIISDDSLWTSREKYLLKRGIEIFGQNANGLSQFMRTKTPSEIKYYLTNFYTTIDPEQYERSSQLTKDEQLAGTSGQIIENGPCVHRYSKVQTNNTKCLSGQLSKRTIVKKINQGILNSNVDKCRKKLPLKRKKILKIKQVELYSEEEIVNMKQVSSGGSDSEIDVESDVDQIINKSDSVPYSVKNEIENISVAPGKISTHNTANKDDLEDKILLENVKHELNSFNIPRTELFLEAEVMTDLETFICYDFFPRKNTQLKAAEFYLFLRNLIIAKWRAAKPQYLTRIDIQNDLSEHTDKTSLNRIYQFLEQIGAINFGCDNVKYKRPLLKLIKCSKMLSQLKEPTSRRRIKKKFLNNGEGGCTVSHGEHGEVIDTTVVNEDPAPLKTKIIKKPPTYLIHCKSFITEYKFKVTLDISTLLLMDFHAHSSLSEVMGLIGGFWSPNNKILSITHYEPCRNLASSNVHCDMCPISQAASAEKIHDLNMELLGWFHSHPTFVPEPSQQDLETQLTLQQWIGYGKPCVGIILAPFYRGNILVPSDFRCMIVEKLPGDEKYLPYKFKVEVKHDRFNSPEFVSNISKLNSFIVSSSNFSTDSRHMTKFNDPYLYDKSITYMDKFLSSVKMTIQRYFPDNESFQEKIVKSIHEICDIT